MTNGLYDLFVQETRHRPPPHWGKTGPPADMRTALESHLMGFAAEEARLRGATVEMATVRSRARRSAYGGP